jgi:methyl-accepting chemotaxis protein
MAEVATQNQQSPVAPKQAEIATASAGQAQGIDQVNTVVTQMDKVTQSNAANAEETASASEELSAQAEQMNQVAEELAAMVGGAASAAGGSKSCWGKEESAKKMLNTNDNAFYQIAGGIIKTPQEIKAAAEKTNCLRQRRQHRWF